MNKFILSLTSAAIIASAGFAQASAGGAGNDGGGGGGVCINGKCMTLAEAGLQAPAQPKAGKPLPNRTAPAISPELLKEYQVLYQSLGRKAAFLFNEIELIENTAVNQFERAQIYDANAVEKIKQLYREMLQASNFPTQNFELFAISTAEKTYLLPAFYNLNPRSQVLILIHEILMYRYKKFHSNKMSEIEALKLITSFDVGILALINNDYSKIDLMVETVTLIPLSNDPYDRNSSRQRYTPVQAIDIELNAYAAKMSRGQGYFRIDKRLFIDLLGSRLRFTAPRPEDKYDDIEFWNLLNSQHPDLSKILSKNNVFYLHLSGARFDESTSRSYSILAEKACATEVKESVFMSAGFSSLMVDSTSLRFHPVIFVCNNKKIAELYSFKTIIPK